MKYKIIAIIAVIIIGLGIFTWYTYYRQPVFENDWESTDTMTDGKWIIDVKINYVDGTSSSLHQLADNKQLSVTYEGSEIESLEFIVKGIAYGTGYNKVYLDLQDYAVTTSVYKATNGQSMFSATQDDYLIVELPVYPDAMGPWSPTLYKNISVSLITIANLAQSSNYPSGDYDIEFMPTGTISYQAQRTDGTSGPITELNKLPLAGIVTVNVKADSITINFIETVNFYYK